MKNPKTFKAWMKQQFAQDELNDIVEHGVDGGFTGLLYTKECAELFDQYEEEIWDLAETAADEMGEKNVFTMASTFKRADMMSSIDGFKNLLVWFAAEEYARAIVESKEVA